MKEIRLWELKVAKVTFAVLFVIALVGLVAYEVTASGVNVSSESWSAFFDKPVGEQSTGMVLLALILLLNAFRK